MWEQERKASTRPESVYVSAGEAARQLRRPISAIYERVGMLTGDWKRVDRKWRINVEALRRVFEAEERWREYARATHVEVKPEPRGLSDERMAPEWERIDRWLAGKHAASILGLTEQRLGELGAAGTIERRERLRRVKTGRKSGRGPRSVWVRWWYRTEDVRRYWELQERRSRDRSLRGESMRAWGSRDRKEALWPSFRETVDTATAAEWLGVCRQHVARLCRQGKLPVLQDRAGRCGSRLRIPAYAVLAMAERADRKYWREVHGETAEANGQEQTGDGYGRWAKREDAERREAAKQRRWEIGRKYGRESERAYLARVEGYEREEGKREEMGFGEYIWTSPRWPFERVECWPEDREYGEREIEHGDFYSTSQVARILRVKPRRVLELRQQGRLRGYRLRAERKDAGANPRWWFFRKEEVEEFAARSGRRRM